jgi:hypothetical protein
VNNRPVRERERERERERVYYIKKFTKRSILMGLGLGHCIPYLQNIKSLRNTE